MHIQKSRRLARWSCLVVAVFNFYACKQEPQTVSITITNKLAIARASETISIPAQRVEELLEKFGAENLLVRDAATDSLLVTQALDSDGDGKADEILFQTSMEANGKKTFTVTGAEDGASRQPKSERRTYARFVPERTDDYAWENDRVAFRTYGPVAQQLVEQGKQGGTLTSGMDAWLKRVSYPIINDWYKKHEAEPGYYHIDHGEGYDPYHVGPSRGIGGTGVLVGDSLHVSKNFIAYKTIAEGPIRTVFELTYAPWQANGNTLSEIKRISLDLGSNLSLFESHLESDKPLPPVTIGVTLHEKRGEAKLNPEQGWFRYWEPMDSAHLGTAIVISPASVQDFKEHLVEKADQSHLYVTAKPDGNRVAYYAGFGWDRSGQFKSKEEWDAYLANFAKRMASPLEVKFE